MQSKTNYIAAEPIPNDKLTALKANWSRLHWYQQLVLLTCVVCAALPRLTLRRLDEHIDNRRSMFAYWYPAHWLKK